MTVPILLGDKIFMGYLAYTIDGVEEPPIDISGHIAVFGWGKTSALRVNSSQGKVIMMDFFQTHGVNLIYGPQGNEAGMTRLQQRVQSVSSFEPPIVGAIFYFNSQEAEEVGWF